MKGEIKSVLTIYVTKEERRVVDDLVNLLDGYNAIDTPKDFATIFLAICNGFDRSGYSIQDGNTQVIIKEQN